MKFRVSCKNIIMNGNEFEYKWPGKVILIVEDEDVNMFFLQAALRKTQTTLIYARTGQEGIARVKECEHIDVILMDIRLPVMNGYEATRIIKNLNPKILVIAQTAYAMSNDREKILNAGCDDYIPKPIRLSSLMEVLNKYLS